MHIKLSRISIYGCWDPCSDSLTSQDSLMSQLDYTVLILEMTLIVLNGVLSPATTALEETLDSYLT